MATLGNMNKLYAVFPLDKWPCYAYRIQYQISGTVTDITTNLPVDNAKISLLDPDTRDVLHTDIYTDANGTYEATIQIAPTIVENSVQELPLNYWISEPYPNPSSGTTTNVITIQYMTPGNKTTSPVLEVFNILGKQVDLHAPLAGGIYLYRIKFLDGYSSKTKKLVVTSGGKLDISLKQIVVDTKHPLKKESSLAQFNKVGNDSMAVLYVIEKSGYAFLKQQKELVDGENNVHDFNLVHSSEEISQIIGTSGGIVEHPGGLKVTFQEGAFSDSITVTISKSELPNDLPLSITPVSLLFSISCGGIQPRNSAMVSFTVDQGDTSEDHLGIYRWNWEEWQYVGGSSVEDTIYTYVRDFSTFLAGTADSKIYRLFRFENIGSEHAMVYVWAYRLLHPEWDVPITWDLGVPCFAAPFEPIQGNLGWYPQGFYQFCADWIDETYGFRHRIIGNDPPNWTYSLGEYTSLIVPPNVYVDTRIAGSLEGPCPCEIIREGLSSTGLEGSWLGTMPPPWGATNLYLSERYWYFYTSLDSTTFPVITASNLEQYIILWDPDDEAYLKIEWTTIDEYQVYITIYDTHLTIEEAIFDTEPQIEDIFFIRSGSSWWTDYCTIQCSINLDYVDQRQGQDPTSGTSTYIFNFSNYYGNWSCDGDTFKAAWDYIDQAENHLTGNMVVAYNSTTGAISFFEAMGVSESTTSYTATMHIKGQNIPFSESTISRIKYAIEGSSTSQHLTYVEHHSQSNEHTMQTSNPSSDQQSKLVITFNKFR